MSDIKKLTTEELEAVKKLKADHSELAVALGELEIEKSRLLDLRRVLHERESELAKQLQEKYGNGSIDLETGEMKS